MSHHHSGSAPGSQGFRPDAQGSCSAQRPDLAKGAGRGKTLYFDAFSGVAGDMIVAALIDLGVPFSVVQGAWSALAIEGATLRCESGRVGAIGASRFIVEVGPQSEERHYPEIDGLLAASVLESSVKELSRRIFRRLAEAEARVHRWSLSQVHFHEVGAIDSIADIVGAAAALDYLGAEVVVSPLPMGRGFIECRHGTLPLPAPATLECLVGIPTVEAHTTRELVTPTGAAIVATVAQRFTGWPAISPQAIGWGAGTSELEDRPNVLRLVLGQSSPSWEVESSEGHVVLEANVDDMTGELAGHAQRLFLEAGALDAWAVPATMKKGRPGWILSAITTRAQADSVAAVFLRETTTLGVRRRWVGRVERARRELRVMTRYGEVSVKIAEGPYGPAQMKPEFDQCAQLARKNSVPVREILAEALVLAREQSGDKSGA